MTSSRLILAGVVVASSVAVGACQSTQTTSAQLEAKGAKLLSSEHGLQVEKTFEGVKVLDTKLITDNTGTAVVVEIENLTQDGLAQLPIAIDVLDKDGKTTFKNNGLGLDPALTTVPVIQPGATVDWVNDQVLPTGGDPDSVKVKIGAPQAKYPENLPDVTLTPPQLESDATGSFVTGKADTEGVTQVRLILFAVARKGGEIVAAGRGGIKRLPPPSGRAQKYVIYFKGNPEGAEVDVTAPPSVLE